MHLLRKPLAGSDITPQLLGAMIDNLNKLQRLSATGATVTELPGGISVDVTPPKKILRARLTEDLYPCQSAVAVFLSAAIDRNDNVQTADGGPLVIYDTLATANGQNLYAIDPNGDGDWRIPAGTCLYIYQFEDDGQWEPVGNFGACCRQGSGSGTSESSENVRDVPRRSNVRRVLSTHDLRIRRIGQPRHLRSLRHLHNKRLRDVELHESIVRLDVHACRLCRRSA